MDSKHTIKLRTCEHCKAQFVVNAETIKEHAAHCDGTVAKDGIIIREVVLNGQP